MDRFLPKTEATIFILGIDCGGKTTLLYLLKLGEILPTIPSIGFNVEVVEAPTKSGPPLKFTAWDGGTGCATITMRSNILTTYAAKGDALIWVVDSADRERLDESVEGLAIILRGIDSKRLEAGSHRIVPVMV